jgi:thymidine kinase
VSAVLGLQKLTVYVLSYLEMHSVKLYFDTSAKTITVKNNFSSENVFFSELSDQDRQLPDFVRSDVFTQIDHPTTLADIGLNVLYVNHQKDVRLTESSDRNLTSHHSGFKGLSDKVNVLKTDCLSQIDVTPYHAIGVDEGQFFEDLDVVVRDWVLNKNKIVIIASLDGNYMMEPFGKAHNLICICNPGDVVKMPAICVKCLSEGDFNPVNAGFTAKLQIDPAVLEGKAQVTDEVGGTDKYVPLCMKCYKEYMQSIIETRPDTQIHPSK